MATDCRHKGTAARTLATAATLTQLLWSGCQQASPDNQVTSPVTAGSSATGKPAATGSAGSSPSATAGRPGTTAMSTSTSPAKAGKAGTGSTQPAATGGNAAVGGSSGSSSTAPTAQAGSSSSGTAGTAPEAGTTGSTSPNSSASSLPAVTDFKAAGPFTPKREAGPSGYVLFYPQELGKDGVKHPILSWGPGAAETSSDFTMLLNHLASHGFAVISYDATPDGKELVTAIDWMLAENMRADSVFYQKLDETKIAAGGHSAGSLATFVIGGDKRLITTLHISGGTFDPHTDIMNLHAPTLFVCGEPGGDGLLMGDVASPNCEIDFNNAMVPVFYGVTKGAAHMTPTDIGDATIRTHQFGAMVGWLRWQLAGDSNAKNMFVGDSCTLCSDAAWGTAKSKNLN